MLPSQIEQLIADRLATVASMPVFSFSANPNALDNIGESGIGLVVYAGSNNTSEPCIGPILLKREISATVIFYTERIEQAHAAISTAYDSLLNYYADDLSPIMIDSDEINATEEGFYQSIVMLTTTYYQH